MLTALYSALWTQDINIVNVSMLITGRAPMNFTPGHSGVSNPWHLLEQAEMRAEKFLPIRERAIVNALSLDGAGILFPIVRPALQSLLAAVPASVPRRAHKLTQEDALQTIHILGQSMENCAVQSEFVAVSQSHQVSDPSQPMNISRKARWLQVLPRH